MLLYHQTSARADLSTFLDGKAFFRSLALLLSPEGYRQVLAVEWYLFLRV